MFCIVHEQCAVLCHSEDQSGLSPSEQFVMLPQLLMTHGWRQVLHLFEPSESCGIEPTVRALIDDLCGLERFLSICSVSPSHSQGNQGLAITVQASSQSIPASAWADASVTRLGSQKYDFRLQDLRSPGSDSVVLQDHGLSPYTEYSYELKSLSTGMTAGPIVACRTAPAAPKAPRQIEVHMSRAEPGKGSVVVPPGSHSINDARCVYTLAVSMIPTDSIETDSASDFVWKSPEIEAPGGFTYDFDNLQPGAKYRIEISALGSMGRSSTAQTEFRMREADPTEERFHECFADGEGLNVLDDTENEMCFSGGDASDFVYVPEVQVFTPVDMMVLRFAILIGGKFNSLVG